MSDIEAVYKCYADIFSSVMGSEETPDNLIMDLPYIGEINQTHYIPKAVGSKMKVADIIGMAVELGYELNEDGTIKDYTFPLKFKIIKEWQALHPNEKYPMVDTYIKNEGMECYTPRLDFNKELSALRKRATGKRLLEKKGYDKYDVLRILAKKNLLFPEEYDEYKKLKQLREIEEKT